MNIFRQEFKMLRGSLLIWTLSLLAIATVYLSVYPAFASDVDTVKEAFSRLPDAVKRIMGTGGFEIFSFPGFFANILPILLLAGGIQAMNMGITLANRERLAQTTDFLITKPVGRSRIFWQKLLAHLTVIALTSIVVIGYIYGGSQVIGADDFEIKTFLMVMGVFTGIQLWFLAVGMAVSALVRRIRAVVGVSMATVFSMLVLSLFGSVIGDEAIRYVTPFKYVDLLEVVKSQAYDVPHILVWAIIVTVGITLSWILYQRRDIHA